MSLDYSDDLLVDQPLDGMDVIIKNILEAKHGEEVRKAMADGLQTLADHEYLKMIDTKLDSIIKQYGDLLKKTDDLTVKIQAIDDSFNKKLNANSKMFEDELDQVRRNQEESLEDFDDKWQAKIDRIVLGTDEEMISKVVEMILKSKED